MRRLLVLVGAILLVSVFPTLLLAGNPPTYLVDRYSNDAGPGAPIDALVRLINPGTEGSPLTSPVGDVCANIYVFDSNQEMIACCSCLVTPNGLVTASVANELTNNPLVSVTPAAGVIKIMPTVANGATCSPTAPSSSSDGSLLTGISTHLEVTGGASFITETPIPIAPLGSGEAAFLTSACTFVQYLGGGYGKGTCGCNTRIYGIAGNISGAGGSGATVNLTGTSTATISADPAGNYSFTGLTTGSYTVTPSKTGFAFIPSSLPATIAAGNSSNLTGLNFSTVAYSVSGTLSGAGGAGASVSLTGTSTATAIADASGNYTFTGLQNGSYTVTPSRAGFIFTPPSLSAQVNNADVTGVNFLSAATYSISGTIGGAGGNGATVNLTGTSAASVTADASGNYLFTGLVNGSYTVTPSKAGFTFTPASAPAIVNNANVTALNFGTVTYSISGTISGAGGSAATVGLTGAATATAIADGAGNYSFTGLQNGSYTVTPSKTGFIFTPPSLPAVINNANVAAINFGTVTYSISGTISGAGGSGATVSLTGAASATTIADSSGNYTFTGLQNGSYTITPSRAGFTFTPASQPVTISNANVTAINFGTVTYSISGTIGGAGGSGATVKLSGAATASVTADASGNYAFTGLTNGSYIVTPSKSGFNFSPSGQPVTINSANVTAVNFGTVTYSIFGTISGAGGAGATVSLTGASSATVIADASGNFAFTGLMNGTYSVSPSQSGFTFTPASQNITVSNASVIAVNFGTVTYSLSGAVSGPGSNGATVTLTGPTTATVAADGSGKFTLSGLNNGSYTVTPSSPGFTFNPDSPLVTINGANVTGVMFSSFPSCPCSLWTSSTVPGTSAAADPNAVEVGVRFTSDVAGLITGIRFYKDATNTGRHIANLWTNTGTLLATAKFTNESTSGWQQVNFASPVPIAAKTTYVASYHTNAGNYSADNNYFTSAFNNSPLHAPQDGTNGANGVYAYGVSAFPTGTYLSTNYYVDVVFATSQTIHGTIRGPGGSGATVTLGGTASATVIADSSGNYTFANVVNGSYTVTPSNPGFTFAPATKAVTVNGADVAALNFTSNPGLAMDQVTWTDRNSTVNTITSPTFTTGSTNELLLALIATDATAPGITVSSVTSADGTLTWSLVQRTNTQLGTAEIWRAFSPVPLTTLVTATLSQSVAASITVVTFTGVDTSTTDGSGAIGATAGNNAKPGLPTASLTTTRNNSWVIGVGNDWDSAISRSVGANQLMVHQFLAARDDTYWVQMQTSTTPLVGTSVTINDTAPTGDRYNLSICEVLPAP